MNTRLAFLGAAALSAALASPAKAADGASATLLQKVSDPGPAVRIAAIECDYASKARPEQRDVEAEAKAIERQFLAEGRPAVVARSMADARRRSGQVERKGLRLRLTISQRYDAASWSWDQRGL